MDAIMTLGEEATEAGALLDTQGLQPSAAGARVSLTGGSSSATDGPFTEAKELISYAAVRGPVQGGGGRVDHRFLNLHRDLWPGWEGEADS